MRNTNGNRHGRPFLFITLGLEMTDEDVVERFHRVVGVGRVTERDRRIKPHHKPQWVWRCDRHEDAVATIELFYPFMGARRQARMDEVRQLHRSSREEHRHPPRPCRRCGTSFVPAHFSQGQYCSIECREKAHALRSNRQRAVRGYVRVALAKRQSKLF